MSEVADKTVETKQTQTPLNPVDVKRGKDGNTLTLSFVSTEMLRAPNKGKLYLAPEVTKENVFEVCKWIAAADDGETLASKIGALMRLNCQGWWDAAMDKATDKETGVTDQQKLYELFGSYASDFEARGESIPDLKNRMEEVVTLISKLDHKKIAAEKFGGDLLKGKEEFFRLFDQYNEEVKKIQIAIEGKKRGPKDSKEDNNS